MTSRQFRPQPCAGVAVTLHVIRSTGLVSDDRSPARVAGPMAILVGTVDWCCVRCLATHQLTGCYQAPHTAPVPDLSLVVWWSRSQVSLCTSLGCVCAWRVLRRRHAGSAGRCIGAIVWGQVGARDALIPWCCDTSQSLREGCAVVFKVNQLGVMISHSKIPSISQIN